MAKPIFCLAEKVFDIQNTRGGVPADVLAAARRVVNGGAGKKDGELIYQYLNIRKTGATQMRKDAIAGNRLLSRIGSYANLGGQLSAGGLQGAGAGLSLISNAASDVEALAKSKFMQQVVVKTVQRMMPGASSAAPEQLLYGVRGGARYLGALATTAGIYGAAAYAGVQIGQAASRFVTGTGATEQTRVLRSNLALTRADSQNGPMVNRLALLRQSQVAIETGRWANSTSPLLGAIMQNVRMRQLGTDYASTGMLQTQIDLRQNRVGELNAADLRAQSKRRFFNKRFGEGRISDLMQAWDRHNIFPTKEVEEGATAESKATLARAQELQQKFYALSQQRRFKAAEQYKNEANAELPGTIKKDVTPERAYQNFEAGRQADIRWQISNSHLAGPRDLK